MVRDAMLIGLQGLGHEVVATANRAEPLSELDQFLPDIVVSDYRLTDRETGIDLISAVRSRLRTELPGILITGDSYRSESAAQNERPRHCRVAQAGAQLVEILLGTLTQSTDVR